MTDDLVKRLRRRELDIDPVGNEGTLPVNPDGEEAADRIEALEAENRELAMQLLATDGQAQEALERAVKAEANVTRAIQTALEMAAGEIDCGCDLERKSDVLSVPPNSGARWRLCGSTTCGAIEAAGIRAIRVEDVLEKREGEP